MVTLPLFFMMLPSIVKTGAPADFTNLWALQIVSILIRLIPVAYFGVRFAPGNATSIARKRFSFYAWKVTRGRFWALLGSFVTLWLIWFAVSIVLWMLAAAALLAQILPDLLNVFLNPGSADAQRIVQSLFTPQKLAALGAFYIVGLIGGMVLAAAFFGVNARAVIVAAEEGKIDAVLPQSVAETFS